MFLRIGKPIWFCMSLAIFAISTSAYSQNTKLSFDAAVVRTIHPNNENPAIALKAGTRISGTIELSEADSKRVLLTDDGKKISWHGAVKKIQFGTPLDVTFFGGNMGTQDGLFNFMAVKNYCTNCSAEGKAFPLVEKSTTGETIEKLYTPTRYVMAQTSDEIVGSSTFSAAISKLIELVRSSAPKLMVLYSESGTTNESVKVILDIVKIESR